MNLDYKNKVLRPAWVEVDLDAVAHNVRVIRKYLGDVKMLAVVKAHGYGLGAVECAREIAANGVDYLGVVMLDEAYELRRAGIDAPILNTGAIYADQADYVLDLGIEQMLYQHDVAGALSKAAQRLNSKARVHVKIDTGMSRFGFHFTKAAAEIARLVTIPNLEIVGAFTHFPMSDAVDKSFALLQIERMNNVKAELESAGIRIPIWHMANSGGTLDLPQAHFDMVRVGLMNYGYWPSFDVRNPFELKPAMSVRARIVAVRHIERGYDRKLSKTGEVLCRGRRFPIIGGLCMDAAFIKITDMPDISVGDVVTLMGRDGEQEISPHDIAGLIGSVSYEVIARFERRLPRVYKKKGRTINIINTLTG